MRRATGTLPEKDRTGAGEMIWIDPYLVFARVRARRYLNSAQASYHSDRLYLYKILEAYGKNALTLVKMRDQ